ncbi:Zinc finger, C2H2 [Akanthomyces lecanii RCEF 1005]|uniref:Zinc finger, C2H2 n=1 Tax=Akanthomyces lecanii RCEF 1005 TaxID=1081108 RepID=A0A167NJI1_CORDF|nr:Zinc finger, C2H2 [Akanthomyces lecanii RCEF 1005]
MSTNGPVPADGGMNGGEVPHRYVTTASCKSRKFVALQHNKFNLELAAETYCEDMKAKLNSFHLIDRSQTRSRLRDLSRPAHTNLPFQYSLYSCEHSLDCRFTPDRYYHHKSIRLGANLNYSLLRNQPRYNDGYEINPGHEYHNYHNAEDSVKEAVSEKRPHNDEHSSVFGNNNLPAEHASQNLLHRGAERRYGCNHCSNRFKNKNEAKRHEQSLHLRCRSWSCAALTDYARAFHNSTHRPGEADICGYCGDTFARTGDIPRTGPLGEGAYFRTTTKQDCNERIQHLQEVHKFRECNSFQKFYRADHMRQHNKLCHGGTRGKWTNMLNNACLTDKDPAASEF